MSARRPLLAAALVVAGLFLVAGATVASAEPLRSGDRAAAAEHLAHGSKLYQQGHYAEAIAELQAGYAIDPRPDFLYALGQAERKRGDCKAAVGWYQRYVDTGPSAQRTVATLMQIDRCKQELAAAPRGPAQPPAGEAPPAVAPQAAPAPASSAPLQSAGVEPAATAPVPSSPRHDHTPLYKRWWLWTTVAVVVVAGAGVGVGVALAQRQSFNSTLPDLTWSGAALGVRF